MSTPPRPAARWSKQTDALVRHIASRCRPSLQSELGHWLESRARFSALVTAHQDKVRKKLTSSDDEDTRLDVRAELVVAYALLADRRFEVTFEAYGAGQRGPDLSVTYRANQRFNLEVTRLRGASFDDDTGIARLANVIAAKLRQFPAEVANALVITGRDLALSDDPISSAIRLLKSHSDARDDAFFARRGFSTARQFHAQYVRLSGVFVVDESGDATGVVFGANREARHPLPKQALAALTACLR